MKKLLILLSLAVFILSGCVFTSKLELEDGEKLSDSIENSETVEESDIDSSSGTVKISNPIMSVDDSAALFDATGISVEAPHGAEDVSYTSISGIIAQIKFRFADTDCCLRASIETSGSTLHGVYSEVESTQPLTVSGVEVTFDSLVGGTYALLWTKDGVNYSLTTSALLDTDLAQSLAENIIG